MQDRRFWWQIWAIFSCVVVLRLLLLFFFFSFFFFLLFLLVVSCFSCCSFLLLYLFVVSGVSSCCYCFLFLVCCCCCWGCCCSSNDFLFVVVLLWLLLKRKREKNRIENLGTTPAKQKPQGCAQQKLLNRAPQSRSTPCRKKQKGKTPRSIRFYLILPSLRNLEANPTKFPAKSFQ